MSDNAELSPDWSFRALDELIESRQAGYWGDPTASDLRPVPVLVVRNGDIDDAGHLRSAAPRFFGAREAERSALRKGDIVLTTSGQVGKVYLATDGDAMLRPSNFTRRIRPRSSEVDAEYLFLTFFSPKIQGALQQHAHGSTIKNLNASFFAERLIPLPPLPEQRAIANVLRTVQQTKKATEQVVAAARELKRSLLAYLFQYGPVPVPTSALMKLEETAVGPMPDHWSLFQLHQIAQIERGKFSHRPRNDPAFYGGQVPFVQTGDVVAAAGHVVTHSQSLNEKGLAVSRVFPRGTIVMTIAANIGYTAILDFDAAFPDSLVGITPGEDIDRDYLNYYLSTQRLEMDRTAPRGTQKNINLQFLRPWPVKVAPVPEQRRIASMLDAVDRKIEAEEHHRADLTVLFDSLLNDLMSTRRRVHAADLTMAAT